MSVADGQDGDGRAGIPARERIAEVLRVALEPREDAPIDDATRRLMLHLSIDPPPAAEPRAAEMAVAEAPPPPSPPSLLRRVLNRSRRRHAVNRPTGLNGRGEPNR